MSVRGGADGGALLVVGDIVTDIVARHRTPPVPGTDTAAAIRTVPGGAGANVACWAASWGCRDVRLLGRVGAESARWHEEALTRAGVRSCLVVDSETPTGTVICLVDGGDGAGAERTFLTDSGASLRLSEADWSPALLDGVGWLHLSGYLFFTTPSRALAETAKAAAHARGIPVSVDPASAGFLAEAGVERFLAATEGVDVLLPSEGEAGVLAGVAGLEGAAGLAGAAGPPEATGFAGAAGLPGAAELAGAAGLPGAAELAGAAGLPGAAELAGATGLADTAGPPEATGLARATALPGAAELAGATGLADTAGPPEATGLARATALPGAAGPTDAAGQPGAAEAAARLSRRYPVVVVKRGSAGALVAVDGEVRAEVPALPAAARDSTGAGDAFTGAFLAARLSGAGLCEASAEGCRAGARAVELVGGRPV